MDISGSLLTGTVNFFWMYLSAAWYMDSQTKLKMSSKYGERQKEFKRAWLYQGTGVSFTFKRSQSEF